MANSIHFAILLVLFGTMCYMIPQAIDKTFDNIDNTVSVHKIDTLINQTK